MATAQQDLEDLYSQHYELLVRHARSRLRDPSEAEDFVHDSFVRAAESVDLNSVDNPRSYLVRVVDNAIFNAYRRNSRIVIGGIDGDVADPDSYVGKDHEKEEARRLVGESMKTLAPRHRRILGMFAGGVPLADIAMAEASTSHKISCIITRAKENLGRELVRRGFVPGVVPTTSFPRVRGLLADARMRIGSLLERLDKEAVMQTVLAATVVAAGAGGSTLSNNAEASQPPPTESIGAKLPVDTVPLPSDVAAAVTDLTSVAQDLQSTARKAVRPFEGGRRDSGPPPDEEGPLPEPDIGPDPNEVVDEVVDVGTHVGWEVIELADRCLDPASLCQGDS